MYGTLYVNEDTKELYITDVAEKLTDLKQIVAGLDTESLRAGNNLATKRYYLKNEKVSDVIGLVRHKLSSDGSLFAVNHLNALVITDIPSKIKEVIDVLKLVDVPTKHIAVEVTVIEFNSEDFEKLGINAFNWLQGLTFRSDLHWDKNIFKNRGSFTLRSNNQSDIERNHNIEQAGEDVMPYHLTSEINVSDLINFIRDNADGTVLANTRLITRNNKEARLFSRELLPFRFYENESSYQNSGENITLSGMEVKVTPTVQKAGTIDLKIEPRISNLTGWSPKGRPIIFERYISTSVTVKDGQTFVLGGLFKREEVEIRKGIPGLKDLPFFWFFFSTRKKIVLEREVLIFIRPTTSYGEKESKHDIDQMYERIKQE